VEWDSRRPSGQRVLSVHLDPDINESTTDTPAHTSGDVTPTQSAPPNVSHDPTDEVKREKGGRTYKVVTREYLATGHDGFDVLKEGKYLIDDEAGQMMSTIVRKYLLGESVLGQSFRSWLKLATLHRVAVREPNVPPGERERSQPDFQASRHRNDRPT